MVANTQTAQRQELTIYDFVIGLVVGMVAHDADGIVAPQLDTRNDVAATVTCRHLEAHYRRWRRTFAIYTNDYRESDEWRQALYHFRETLFYPKEEGRILIFDKDMVARYAAKSLRGESEMWYELADVFIKSYHNREPQWDASLTGRYGFPNRPYVIGADTLIFGRPLSQR